MASEYMDAVQTMPALRAFTALDDLIRLHPLGVPSVAIQILGSKVLSVNVRVVE